MDTTLDLLGDGPRRGAQFHGDHRLTLWREFGSGPRALVIGCNPSDASAEREDQTSRWWNAWFPQAGFGRYDVVNLYPFCTPKPAECRRLVKSIDSGRYDLRDDLHFVNLPHVVAMAKAADQVFVCWGNIAWDAVWIDHVVEQIQTGEAPYPELWCWGKTKSGAPMHPAARGKHRIPTNCPPILWKGVTR